MKRIVALIAAPRCWWLFFLVGLCCTGCYDTSFGEPKEEQDAWAVTTTLSSLNELYRGERLLIERNWVVAGRVTAHDEGGNFYHSLLIEAEGAAVELKIGLDGLHNDFPLGTHLLLSLEGLAIDRQYGVLQVGMMPPSEGSYALYEIASKAALDRYIRRTGEAQRPLDPVTVRLDELTPSMAGRLVRIEALVHTPETPVEAVWSGYRRFTDAEGRAIYTYVRSYADFAEERLPEAACTLCGILQYDQAGDGRYLLKLRDENDCQ